VGQEDPHNLTALFVISIFRQHRDVVRALRDHRRVARREPYTPWANAVYNPTGRLGHHGRQLRWFFMWFPAVREELPTVSIAE